MVLISLVISQRVSCFENFQTDVAFDARVLDVPRLDVVHDVELFVRHFSARIAHPIARVLVLVHQPGNLCVQT